MQNLELFNISHEFLKGISGRVQIIYRHANYIYVLKDQTLFTFNLTSGDLVQICDKHFCAITPFVLLQIEEELWFATSHEAVYISLSDNTVRSIDFEFDCLAAEWNSAQDTLIIVSNDGEVGAYYVDLHEERLILVEKCNLHQTVCDEFVSVGWGSATTQFVGKARKGELKKPEDVATVENKQPFISWRGNGEMFAVNYWEDGKRLFKVFQHPCTLLCQSEEVAGLQPYINWRPEGNIIAAVAIRSWKYYLQFFEKNCMFRHEFELHQQKSVQEIKWSSNGEVLSVLQGNDLNLYVTKNYIWYLKQQLHFGEENPLISYQFLTSRPSVQQLEIITAKDYAVYSFKSTLHFNMEIEETPLTCATINGSQVFLTHYKNGVIPPPMFHNFIEAEAAVNFIAFNPKRPQIALIDTKNVISFYNYSNKEAKPIGKLKLDQAKSDIPLKFRNFLWDSTDNFIFMSLSQEDDTNNLLIVKEEESNYRKIDTSLDIDQSINYFVQADNCSELVEQRGSDVVITDNTEIQKVFTATYPSLIMRSIKIDNNLYVFSLGANGSFFIDDYEIFKNILSFIIHGDYLFLSSTEHKLFGFRLNTNSLNEMSMLKFENLYNRQIEQGAMLLFGIPNTSFLVMQMPRGNLEISTCRMVSVDRIEQLVQERKWNEALDVVRLEKICSNVLLDLNVERFISDAKYFVTRVEVPTVLNDFVLGLQEEDVFDTLYKNCRVTPCTRQEKKLERVCNALIAAMEQVNYVHYCTTIIICCLLKNSTESIREALEHVRNLLHLAEQQDIDIKVAQEALQILNTLSPKSDIYKEALASYDLDLAFFVARNSQMDPKEYEPFIDNLNASDPLTRRYLINHFLKKYNVALRYLIRGSEDQERILEYIREHTLYKEAYLAIGTESSLYKSISEMYGSHLNKKCQFNESAIVYLRGGFTEDALEGFIHGLHWEEAILLIEELQFDKHQKEIHLQRICSELKAKNRMLDASYIYENYLHDQNNAVSVLMEGKLFKSASDLAHKHKRKDLIETKLLPAIFLYCKQLCEKFAAMYDTFLKYSTRLTIVQSENQKKAKMDSNDYDLQKASAEDDIFSLADSTASRTSKKTTRYSSMSSRNRRKEERKKQDLREGGMYEDIALIRALYELYREAFQYGSDVRDVCFVVMKIQKELPDCVPMAHNLLLKLQTVMKNSINQIWPATINDETIEDADSKVIQKNISLLDVKFRAPPENLNTNWKISILDTI